MPNVWRDVRGTILSIFQIGLGQPQIRGTSTELQTRDAADADYVDFHMQDVILQKAGSAFKLTVQSPTLASDQILVLPGGGTVPTTTGGRETIITSFTQATGATFSLDATPPVNGTLVEVRVIVDTAAGGSTPTLSVGISGTPARDMAAAENNLKQTGQYVTEPWLALGGSPAAIIATMAAAAQTFTGRVALTYVLA